MLKANGSTDGRGVMLSRRRQVLCSSTAFSLLLRAAPVALAALSFASEANAQASNWTGGDGNWTNATKWSTGAVPTGGDAGTNPAIIGTGAAGTVTIDSASAARNVQVGGGSTLQVINGATFSTTPTINGNSINTIGLAGLGSGTGTMLISGAGSTWQAGIAGVRAGNGAAGTITVQNGGKLVMDNGLLSIGLNASGNGTLNINAGSVTNTQGMRAGYNGATGTVNITNGGTLLTSSASNTESHVGDGTGGTAGTGVVNISGTGSSWTIAPTGHLIIGHMGGGTGTINVSAGGKLDFQNATDAIQVGFRGGKGTLNATGAQSVVTSAFGATFGVGAGSTGTGLITNGATFDLGTTSTLILGFEGGRGDLTVSNGGKVTGRAVTLGDAGLLNATGSTGTLNVNSGGIMNLQDVMVVGAGVGAIGGTGTVNLDGAGSQITTAGRFWLGRGVNSVGTMNISNGAVATATGDGFLVGDIGGKGTLNISSGGKLNDTALVIGVNGATSNGTVNLSGAAQATLSRGVEVGWNGGTAVLNVTGQGTSLKVTDNIIVGHDAGAGLTTTGTMTIADGANVKANTIVVGFANGGVGTLNIGSGAAAGTIDPGVTYVAMGGASSTINFNHNQAAYTFGTVINNVVGQTPTTGSVNFIGSGTTTLTAVNTYTSATNINAGRLVVASGASIADSVLTSVNNGGTLSGAGSVGNVNVASGGTIAQNGTDKLTVKDITFAAGSSYQVGINANGTSGGIAANNATLNGGTVKVMAGSGTFTPGTSYAIVTTTGTRTGQFASAVTTDLVFLQAGLNYTANAVNLQLTRNGTSFESVANTPNQRGVASGLANLGGSSLYNAVLQQNVAGAQQAFDALSGEAHGSAQASMITTALAVGDLINNRLEQPYGASSFAPDTSAASGYVEDSYASLNYAAGKVAAKSPFMSRKAPVMVTPDVVFTSWAQGMGSWLDRSGNANAAELKSTTGGVVSGVDATWMGKWRFGVAGGYSHSDIDVNARNSALDVDSYHVSVYGGARQGRFGLQGGYIYSWNEVSSNRRVAFPGFIQTVLANYNSSTSQFFGELNYQYYFTGTSWFETFAGANYLRHETDAFNETGGAAALAVAAGKQDVTYTTLGLRAASLLGHTGDASFIGRGTLGWRHAFNDVGSPVLASFAGGTPFTVSGVPIATDAILAEAGVDMNFRQNMTFGISWAGQFGDGAHENRVNGKFVYRW